MNTTDRHILFTVDLEDWFQVENLRQETFAQRPISPETGFGADFFRNPYSRSVR